MPVATQTTTTTKGLPIAKELLGPQKLSFSVYAPQKSTSSGILHVGIEETSFDGHDSLKFLEGCLGLEQGKLICYNTNGMQVMQVSQQGVLVPPSITPCDPYEDTEALFHFFNIYHMPTRSMQMKTNNWDKDDEEFARLQLLYLNRLEVHQEKNTLATLVLETWESKNITKSYF